MKYQEGMLALAEAQRIEREEALREICLGLTVIMGCNSLLVLLVLSESYEVPGRDGGPHRGSEDRG